jgi:hypothetical protein
MCPVPSQIGFLEELTKEAVEPYHLNVTSEVVGFELEPYFANVSSSAFSAAYPTTPTTSQVVGVVTIEERTRIAHENNLSAGIKFTPKRKSDFSSVYLASQKQRKNEQRADNLKKHELEEKRSTLQLDLLYNWTSSIRPKLFIICIAILFISFYLYLFNIHIYL